jgi:putative ABC transport system permease protein
MARGPGTAGDLSQEPVDMNLHTRPIISAVLRNWTGPVLVAAQIAVTLAVLANAVYIVEQRIEKMDRPTGIDVPNIFVVQSAGATAKYAHDATIRADIAYLRAVPGVIAATSIDYPPLSDRGNRVGLWLKPNDQAHGVRSNYYEVDEQALDALGLRLSAGRFFRHDEILPSRQPGAPPAPAHVVVITRALAQRLYNVDNAVGRTLYDSFNWLSSPATVVGVVERMQGSRLGSESAERTLLAPRLPYPDEPTADYLVRTKPGMRDRVMRTVAAHLLTSNPDRLIQWVRPLEFFKNRSYLPDRNVEIFLIGVVTVLMLITCIGVYGLATFNVRMRTKQIGIRRALGAQRADIVRYFLVENWLISSAGVLIGCALAIAAGLWLATHYGLPRLDLYYLAGGIPVLMLVGLFAAWWPAWTASSVPPAVATRNI